MSRLRSSELLVSASWRICGSWCVSLGVQSRKSVVKMVLPPAERDTRQRNPIDARKCVRCRRSHWNFVQPSKPPLSEPLWRKAQCARCRSCGVHVQRCIQSPISFSHEVTAPGWYKVHVRTYLCRVSPAVVCQPALMRGKNMVNMRMLFF